MWKLIDAICDVVIVPKRQEIRNNLYTDEEMQRFNDMEIEFKKS
jgi:hypothetical protein